MLLMSKERRRRTLRVTLLRRGPNDARSLFSYGLALYTAKKNAEAKAVFEQCKAVEGGGKWVNQCKQMLKFM